MANKLVARLCLLFGEPDTHDAHAWFAEMDRLVKGYSERELDRAADIVLRTHRTKNFPPVAVMLTACEDARQDLAPARQYIKPSYGEWSVDRVKKADALIKCAMGRRAAQEGWIFALHSFIRENERLPGQHEIGPIKMTAIGFDKAYQDCVDGRGGIAGAALARLGASMLERRAELERISSEGAAQ